MAIFLWLFPFVLEAAPVSLAEWTFPHNPDDHLADTATPENSTEILSVTGASAPTFNTAGATTNAIRATGWQNGAETKYWSTKVNTLDYKNILVSVKLRSSSTGPRDFSLQYRLAEDEAWQDVLGGTLVVADNFTTGSLEALPLPATTENQEVVYLRLVMKTNQSVANGMVSSTGANRLDDLLITGSLITEPEEVPLPAPGDQCTGEAGTIRINEILPYPVLSDQEYAELFNAGDQCVNLSGWRLEDAGNHKYIFPTGTVIESREHQILVQNLFLNNTTPDTLTLYTAENEEIDQVTYEKAIKGFSYSFDGALLRFTSFLTPGAENIFDELDEEEFEPGVAGTGIILNEVFPNPLSDEATNEFIELKNITDQEQSLDGWSLVDASQKIFTFAAETHIAPNSLFTIPRSDFGFSLNNTGTETLTLLDPLSNTISEVAYTGAQENFSYSFDGSHWHWTKKITPDAENEFSKNPKITITEGEDGYVDIPLTFKAEIKNAKKPYTYSWDFGDGRRSTLAEPKHTFTKTGKYKASVTLRSESGTTEKEFSIEIKKYPKHPVFITRLMANPEGKDAGVEWVEIHNMAQKRVDLTDWKLATGTEDPVNHPFLQNIVLAPNQTLRLTRRNAAFSLPNSNGVVELRYPNNEVASATRYEEEEIEENDICTNIQEHCDFKNSNAKEKETAEGNVQKVASAPDTRSLQETSGEPPTLPTKKEILTRMGDDFNLLMNQLFLDTFSQKEN